MALIPDFTSPDTEEALQQAMLIWSNYTIIWGPIKTPTDAPIPEGVGEPHLTWFRTVPGWGVVMQV